MKRTRKATAIERARERQAKRNWPPCPTRFGELKGTHPTGWFLLHAVPGCVNFAGYDRSRRFDGAELAPSGCKAAHRNDRINIRQMGQHKGGYDGMEDNTPKLRIGRRRQRRGALCEHRRCSEVRGGRGTVEEQEASKDGGPRPKVACRMPPVGEPQESG
jgi:hypothetical protein